MISIRMMMAPVVVLTVSGCNTSGTGPLTFIQAQTVGISASAGGAQVAPEVSLGYRDLDVAFVPTMTADGTPLKASETQSNFTETDALSVIGQFNVNSTAAATNANFKADLGKFFATGMAAKVVADGFSAQLKGKGAQ